jgi:hypothetical protein
VNPEQLGLDAAQLEAAVREHLPRNHPSLRELLARRPEWAELLPQVAQPTDLTATQLSLLNEEARPEDRLLVNELLAQAGQRASERTKHRPQLPAPWMLAAAACVLSAGALIWWLGRSAAEPEPVHVLGGDPSEPGGGAAQELSCSEPRGQVAEYGTFLWESQQDLAEGESFVVVVSALLPDGSVGAELARTRQRSRSWTPDALQAATWPDRIHWTVRSFDALDFPVAVDEASAERLPH